MAAKQHSCAIAIFSFDGYADLWGPFFDAWFKFWPDCPYPIYLQTNSLTFEHPNVNCIKVGPDQDWSTSAQIFLSEVVEKHILVVMEDYILIREVDSNRIDNILRYVIENKIGCFRLFASPGPDMELAGCMQGELVGEISLDADYRVSLQAAIWDKEVLHNLIVPGESAWSLEIDGTRRSRELSNRFLSIVGPAGQTSPLPYFCTAVEKGEWLREAVRLCRLNGSTVDLSKRKIEPLIQTLLRRIGMTRFIPVVRKIRSLGWLEALVFIFTCGRKWANGKILIILKSLFKSFQRRPCMGKVELAALEKKFVADIHSTAIAKPYINSAWQGFSDGLCNNSLKYDVSSFLEWSVIKETMFFSNADYTSAQIQDLKHSRQWKRFRKALREDAYGKPSPSKHFPFSSGNLIHHASHVFNFEEMIGFEVNRFDAVVEFGGGYGSMCRLIRRLGFRGDYMIFDLPPFTALQKLFLSATGSSALLENDITICTSEIADVKCWVEDLAARHKKILFVGTWSISEAPLEARQPFIDLINQFSGALIAYQEGFQSVNNVQYFGEVMSQLNKETAQNWRFAEQKIPNMALEIGRYLFAINESDFINDPD